MKLIFEDAFKKLVWSDSYPKAIFQDLSRKLVFDALITAEVTLVGIFDPTFDLTFE